jgi:hypothetical protein
MDWKTFVAGVFGVVIGTVGTVATGWFTYASKGDELRVHLVEIAIGILRADPKEDVVPARAWAIEVIEKNSDVSFKEDDRKALLHKPIGGAPADSELSSEEKKTLFEGYAKDGFVIIPHKELPDGSVIVPQGSERIGLSFPRMGLASLPRNSKRSSERMGLYLRSHFLKTRRSRCRNEGSLAVPTIDLPDDALAAVMAAVRRAIEDDRYPHAPRLDPLRSALTKLEPSAGNSASSKKPPTKTVAL